MSVEKLFSDAVGSENFYKDEPMYKHSTFKTGGKAEYFVTPPTKESIIKVLKIAKENSIPYVVVGNGSNILVSDKGIKGLVISFGKTLSDISVNENEITAGAGTLLAVIANVALDNELNGFEFAAGIPASFGGAVFMNAGAYTGEIKQVLKSVKVLSPNMEIKDIDADKLDLGYRHSNIKENGYIILEGTIKLNHGEREEIKSLMADFNGRRRDKQPLNFPSAGSTFKRPEGHFAGKLVEDCGLKGYSVGGAKVSEKHAGFVVNTGSATTKDILDVIEHCKETVYEKFGINLECEVRLLGEF